jgi:hypothetical protein
VKWWPDRVIVTRHYGRWYVTIRAYDSTDLDRCMAIVDEAWDFSAHLRPPALAEFALRMYTAGSRTQRW